jgi:mannosylglycoprotein endo-beta-mannosidase
LRGQMYDYYLDVNACLYGLHSGSEPLHIMYDPVTGMTMIANNTFRTRRDLMMQVRVFDMAGKGRLLTQQFFEVGPTIAKSYLPIGRQLDGLRKKEGLFLSLRLVDTKQTIVSDNFYWLPDSTGVYSGLQGMGKAALAVEVAGTPVVGDMGRAGAGSQVLGDAGAPAVGAKSRIVVTLRNPAGGPVAFFNRVSLVDPATKKRLLPVFYSDNYISVLPGESKTVILDYTPHAGAGGAGTGAGVAGTEVAAPLVSVRGWNVEEKFYPVGR